MTTLRRARIRQVVRPDPAAVHDARRAIASFTRHAFPPDTVERIVLLTSEVVTNAVLHAAPPIWIDARLDGTGLHVATHDGSPEPPRPRDRRLGESVCDACDIGGWGLVLVRELADAWGCRPVEGGKVVWFEVRYPAPRVHHDDGDPSGPSAVATD